MTILLAYLLYLLFDITIEMQRFVCRKSHRNNVPANTPEEYYRRAIFLPFLDHVRNSLTDRFNTSARESIKFNNLIPENILKIKSDMSLRVISDDLKSFYAADLVDIDFYGNILNWRQKWLNNLKDCPKSDIIAMSIFFQEFIFCCLFYV